MKRAILATSLLLLLAAPARAAVLQTVDLNGKEVHPRWNAGALPLQFVLNDRPLDLLPNLTRGSTPLAAVQASMESWGAVPVAMSLNGNVATASLAQDDVNLITLADTPENRDVAGNGWGVTLSWFRERGQSLEMFEADVVLNPQSRMATDGAAGAGDLQSVLTHELGHALGLGHSPIFSSTMFPAGGEGQTTPRTLEQDDLSGARLLYVGATDGKRGAITGQVQTTSNSPVFAGHVGVIDKEGIIRVGTLTGRDGRFTLPALEPGEYQLFVEPLDGPVVPEHFTSEFWHDRQHPVLTAFQTTFAGGNRTPSWVRVEAGKTTALETIKAPAGKPGLNAEGFLWTTDVRNFQEWGAPISLGRPLYVVVVGNGLERVPQRGFTFSSPTISIDPSQFARDTLEDGTPFAVMEVWRGTGARPGGYSLYMTTDTERVLLPGIVEVVAP